MTLDQFHLCGTLNAQQQCEKNCFTNLESGESVGWLEDLEKKVNQKLYLKMFQISLISSSFAEFILYTTQTN